MPERFRTNIRGTSKYKPTRKQRKLRYIQTKNKCRDPSVGHGTYYSYHVPQEVMSWIDIYFPSKFHKGRYFSVALTTLEYMGYVQDEWKAGEIADENFPHETLEMISKVIPRKSPKDTKYYSMDFKKSDWYDLKKEFEETTKNKLVSTARMMRPNWSIDRDYWDPAIGLHATLNTPSLTEEVIKQFIADFQAAGEPITPGLVWEGEEVEVVPAKLDERYAESRSNQRKADFNRGSADQDV